MRRTLHIFIVAIVVALAGSAVGAAEFPEVLAKVGNREITLGEAKQGIEAELIELRDREVDTLVAGVQDLVADALLVRVLYVDPEGRGKAMIEQARRDGVSVARARLVDEAKEQKRIRLYPFNEEAVSLLPLKPQIPKVVAMIGERKLDRQLFQLAVGDNLRQIQKQKLSAFERYLKPKMWDLALLHAAESAGVNVDDYVASQTTAKLVEPTKKDFGRFKKTADGRRYIGRHRNKKEALAAWLEEERKRRIDELERQMRENVTRQANPRSFLPSLASLG